MGNWMTAEQISHEYLVGEARLLSYAERGNLAFRRSTTGAILYDESFVARFFRKRHAQLASVAGGAGSAATPGVIGVLGVTRLGEQLGREEENPRSMRRRAVRHESSPSIAWAH